MLRHIVRASKVFCSENMSYDSQNGFAIIHRSRSKSKQGDSSKRVWNGCCPQVLRLVKWSRIEMERSHSVHTVGSVNINSCSKRSPFSSTPFSMLKKFRMNVRAALGSDAGLKGKRRNGISKALDFSSIVQPLNNSCISSGSTSFRVQASPSQSGFGGGAETTTPLV